VNTLATLDHLVVTAPNLKSGVQWVRDALGVTPELGGKHPRMGTHNCLLRLGEQTYLEVISPDPNAPDPERPRWFALDRMKPGASAQLATWVARTKNIEQAVAATGESLGAIEPMERGDLNWLITVTDNGLLPLAGIAPILIEWRTPTHPAAGLRDSGCRLLQLDLYHPEPARVERILRALGVNGDQLRLQPSSERNAARLVATLQTPDGVKTLPGE
jgi:hypothetical protein